MHIHTALKRSLAMGITVAMLGAGIFITALPAMAHDSTPIVTTKDGKLRGVSTQNADIFRGVPFAAPPLGELRWKAPAPVASWKGVREASEYKSPCAALPLPEKIGIPSRGGSNNEDCLYLNVYMPKKVHKNTPVMVFIHGGGFQNGAGSDHDGEILAAKSGNVVVTINYRMGPFGFLALPALSAETPKNTSGNLGILDQQAALKWVQRNIAKFNGNADNVSLFGISAGGRSACIHMSSPASKGLFDKAMIQSSPCSRDIKTLAASESQGTAIATQAGCSDIATQLACLRSKTTAEILAAGGNSIGTWGPNVDGVVVPQQFTTAANEGKLYKMPVIQGTTHDEYGWHVMVGFDGVGQPVTAAQYPNIIQSLFGATDQPAILAEYPVENYPTPSLALATVVTDARYSCSARTTDQLLSRRMPTYAYEFNDQDAPDYLWEGRRGPIHAAETPYLFRVPNDVSSGYLTPQQGQLSDQIISYWATFARTGNPNNSKAPFWPTYKTSSDKVQSLQPGNIHPSVTFASDHNCGFWESL